MANSKDEEYYWFMARSRQALPKVPIRDSPMWNRLGKNSYDKVQNLQLGQRVDFEIPGNKRVGLDDPNEYEQIFHGSDWSAHQQIIASLRVDEGRVCVWK